jgi:sugar phosphate isomerase/epimerase
MQYGAMNFPVKPVLEEIERIAGLGFDYVELAMDPPMAHHSLLAANRDAIVQTLARHNLQLVCHLPTFVSTADLTESLRQASATEMLESLATAKALGAGKAVLHPSAVTGMAAFVPAIVKDHAFDFLDRITAAAKQLQMTLCLENMFPRYRLGVTPEELGEMFAAFPSLRFTLDTGHAHIDDPTGDRLLRLVERFGERLGHLHFSDNHGRRDDHLAIGRGAIDFEVLVHRLKKIGYDDTLTLEIFEEDHRLLVDSRTAVKTMFQAA